MYLAKFPQGNFIIEGLVAKLVNLTQMKNHDSIIFTDDSNCLQKHLYPRKPGSIVELFPNCTSEWLTMTSIVSELPDPKIDIGNLFSLRKARKLKEML